jgi:peptidoglycan/xylan/chitin deacetylase (PgdA/CDA1 family)
MALERKANGYRWPGDARLPIVLTFEHQSGEGTPPRPGDRPNFLVGGQIEYGARRGIWNVLELLDRFGIKSAFFVSGATAEKYPEAVRAAHAAGHEIAGMGYSFEKVRTSSAERETGVIRRSVGVLEDTCGAKVRGWRCPDYRPSPQTLDILSKEGLSWDSSILNDDLPYVIECEGGRVVEIPFSLSTADKSYIAFPYPMRGGPDGLGKVWEYEFDVLYGESQNAPRFMIISMQTWAIGKPAPLRTLKMFLERITAYNDVRFARCDELSSWVDSETSNEVGHVD